MKKLFVLLLGLILFSASSYSQTGFNSVYSKDGIHVIAVGPGGLVYMSYDGGVTFGSYPIGGSPDLKSVYAVNNRAYTVGGAGAVFISTNAGTTWTNYGIGGASLNSVYFADENTGWAVGDGGRVVKSINGGASWNVQTSGTSQNLNGVKFINSNTGYACGNNGTVIYTTNGGTSWLSYSTGTTKNLLSIDAVSPNIVATGADGIIAVYNGSSWSVIDYKSVIKPDVRSVAMITSTAFYTCGGGGFINFTSNFGASRTYQANPMQGYLSDIYFFDANRGWAVANDNRAILRTTNGGNTWQFQTGVTVNKTLVRVQNTSGNIGNPFCLHPKNKDGVFILAGSTLYRSLNKGDNWVQLAASIPGGTCHSFYVNALDTNLMMAAKGTSGGRIIGSTNYGVSWYDIINPINLTSYGMPLEQDPNDPNTVYLGPDNLPLRKSTNWGANWQTLSGGEAGGIFRSPCDIIIQYENPNVIIVGDGVTGSGSGKVWKSIDGGLNWSLINTVTGSEIPMIAQTSLNLNLIYHSTWSSGSFWKSLNMGSNFSNLNQSGSLWATDIAKDDPTAVTYDQYGTNTYLSLDEGATFQMIPATSSPAAGVCFMDKATLLYQHGSGVDKLVITYNVTPIVSAGNNNSEIPSQFGLSQNYPNPFNPSTQIKYDVPKASFITIKVFDILGKEAAIVFNGFLNPSTYTAQFDASKLSAGIYFYTLYADGVKIDTKKMILVK
jgi:photosystem II stability/assembly factor-like uncharacterized protein